MGRDPLVARARDLADRRYLRVVHHRLVRLGAGDELVAGGVDLEGVDALAAHLAGDTAEVVRPVADDLEALAVLHVAEANVAEAAGDGHLGGRREHPRPRDLARLDRVPDHDVEPGLGGGRAAKAREPLVEQELRVAHGEEGVLLGGKGSHPFEAGGVGERRMGVGLDETRHQGRAAAVDDVRALVVHLRPHVLDAVALHPNLAGDRGIARAVENLYVGEDRVGHGCLLDRLLVVERSRAALVTSPPRVGRPAPLRNNGAPPRGGAVRFGRGAGRRPAGYSPAAHHSTMAGLVSGSICSQMSQRDFSHLSLRSQLREPGFSFGHAVART